jgi:hypothetical protein
LGVHGASEGLVGKAGFLIEIEVRELAREGVDLRGGARGADTVLGEELEDLVDELRVDGAVRVFGVGAGTVDGPVQLVPEGTADHPVEGVDCGF